MNRLFSKESVNTGRQLEFDLAKALTIVLMIWCHIFETITTTYEPSISSINANFRSELLGAVTFMFCMGIGMSYTRHNSAEECISRGWKLLTVGFVLLLFRDVIIGAFIKAAIYGADYYKSLVLGVSCDILQFAGLAFLLVGVFKKLKVSAKGMLLISFAMSIAGTLLQGISTGIYGLDQILGFFWGTYSESYFPLFNWFIFVAAGQWYGERYQYIADKTKFHLISLILGAAIGFAYIYYVQNVEQNFFKAYCTYEFYAHRPFPEALICLFVNSAFISLLYFVGKILPEKSLPVLTHPSIHINQYYCISWVIIKSASVIYCGDRLLTSDKQTIPALLIVLAITILIVIVYSRCLQQKFEAFFSRKRKFWTVFVWGICIASFIFALIAFDSYPNFYNNYSVN